MILFASGYDLKIQKAEREIAGPSKSTVWRGYHDFQSLYMKGLLDGDESLQIRALEGLIRASRKLGLDPTRYYNALHALRPDAPKASSSSPQKRDRLQKKSASVKKPSSVPKKRSAGRYRKVLETEVADKQLLLRLDSPLHREGLRHFVLKKGGRYLYVFDLTPARVPYSIKRIRGEGFREIRIAQFDPGKVRVVIETQKRYTPQYAIENGTIRITLPGYRVVKPGKREKKPLVEPTPVVVSGAAPALTKGKKSAKTSSAKRKSAASAVPSSSAKLRRYTVVIDPGHGGRDAGAVGYGRKREKDAVLAVAKAVKKELQRRGFNVYLTRSRDLFIPLKRRTRYANRKQADFFISIHANAAPKRSHWNKSRGIETYFLSRARTDRAKRVAAIENSAEIKNIDRYTKEAYLSVLNREKIIESNKLAIDLQRQMLSSVRSRYKDVVDNGVREGPFWVLVGAQMPAVLIEIGYITNPTESKRLFSKRYQELLAKGIANGIQSYIYHTR